MKQLFWFFPAIFLLSTQFRCGNSDYSKAEQLYHANETAYKRALQEPELHQAVEHLEAALRQSNADPQALVLLWKCLIKLRAPEQEGIRRRIMQLGPAAQPMIKESLADKNEVIRQKAAALAGDMRIADAAKPLIGLLNADEFLEVQQAAAQALAQISPADAVEPLLAKLRDDNSQVRYYAAKALGQFRDPEIAPALLDRLKAADETLDVRHQAANSLAFSGDQRVRPELTRLFSDPAQPVDTRILAASALASLGDAQGFPFILKMANGHENMYYRGLAVSALGLFNRPESLNVLRQTAQYGNKALRMRAADALEAIGTPETISILQLLAEDSNAAVKERAQLALEATLKKLNPQN